MFWNRKLNPDPNGKPWGPKLYNPLDDDNHPFKNESHYTSIISKLYRRNPDNYIYRRNIASRARRSSLRRRRPLTYRSSFRHRGRRTLDPTRLTAFRGRRRRRSLDPTRLTAFRRRRNLDPTYLTAFRSGNLDPTRLMAFRRRRRIRRNPYRRYNFNPQDRTCLTCNRYTCPCHCRWNKSCACPSRSGRQRILREFPRRTWRHRS